MADERGSKVLSWFLRHGARKKGPFRALRPRAAADDTGLPVYADYWVRASDLLATRRLRNWTEANLRAVVDSSRFEGRQRRYDAAEHAEDGGLFVRATYGWSMPASRRPVQLLLDGERVWVGGAPPPPPPAAAAATVPTLTSKIVALVCDNIRDLGALGDGVDDHVRQLILERLREQRLLTRKTLTPLLEPPLARLDLSDMPVTEGLVRAVARSCPGLRELRLGKASVMNNALVHGVCRGCPLLRELSFSGAPVSDAGLRAIARLEHLEVLELADCAAVDDEGLAAVLEARGGQLRRLVVRGTSADRVGQIGA